MVPMKIAEVILNVLGHKKVLAIERGSSGMRTIN